MKKVFFLCTMAILFAVITYAQTSAGSVLYAAAKTVSLKSSAGIFAADAGSLAYGEQVTVLQVKGNWVEVQSASNKLRNGWTSLSNLTARRIITDSRLNVSANEQALGGKGFNEEVESAYKTKSRLNYADVDRIEAQVVPTEIVRTFLEEGHLVTELE
jgi:uncharacterized protein YgiM (DUF1202 family)